MTALERQPVLPASLVALDLGIFADLYRELMKSKCAKPPEARLAQSSIWKIGMLFDFEVLKPAERYKLLLATVMPRSIAWITTSDKNGSVNAAPFSFFNVFGSDPATVGVGIGSRAPGEPKDTRANIRAKRTVRG